MTINPKEVAVPVLQSYLQGIIAPRPIAFASTVDKEGNVNLTPFSFFNLFSSNPPIVVFSPSRRVRDGSVKHSLENVIEVPEVVINVVNYAIVQQASLASTEYPKGVDEFVKSGLTSLKSVLIKPPRVGESPASMECSVKQVIPLGDKGGAGNLVICEVLLIHISEDILNDNQKVDPFKLDAVARMGEDWYCRAHGDAIFKVPKPLMKFGIGVDQIPERIRNSNVLTGNDLGMLGNIERLPDNTSVDEFKKNDLVKVAFRGGTTALHKLAHELLKNGEVENAWKVLLISLRS
ncbi:MAG TPA: flavin reductase family protein [Cyclobacteriaceae bacterium]|nr:flavin reductase family protein [Cyclobacteriaceae bacterium]